jgi:metal-responsive CopG/Arc/MetJ family transcriptional regulator
MPKVNISLPDDVLRELDKAAREANTSRSAFLAQAVKHLIEELEEEKQMERRLQAAAAIDRIREELGPWDGTAEILKWRDMH